MLAGLLFFYVKYPVFFLIESVYSISLGLDLEDLNYFLELTTLNPYESPPDHLNDDYFIVFIENHLHYYFHCCRALLQIEYFQQLYYFQKMPANYISYLRASPSHLHSSTSTLFEIFICCYWMFLFWDLIKQNQIYPSLSIYYYSYFPLLSHILTLL
jgi:hypothetical protein